MNTEKIEKLKKGLTNSQIPESLREKIREQIKKMEAEDLKESASKVVDVAPKEKEEPTPAPKVEKAKVTRTPRVKKVVAQKESTAKKPTAMALAKDIRKDGESWKEAVKRASSEMKKGTTETKKAVVETKKATITEMQKLLKFVKRRKELKGVSGTNLQRDASRSAKPKGVRKVTHSGETSNQYGTYDNHLGRKYTENRDRHSDRLAPNYPKGSPKLANGGFMDGVYAEEGAEIDKRDKQGMIYALQEHVSSGEIANMTHLLTYDSIAETRSKAIQYYVKYGDKPYSMTELKNILSIVSTPLYHKYRSEFADGGDFMSSAYAEEGAEVTYTRNKDGIRVKSVAMPEERLTEAEWLAKHNESREARTYAVGGGIFADTFTGTTGTHYTGLVGETNAMSSGEMFMAGGRVRRTKAQMTKDRENKEIDAYNWYVVDLEENKAITGNEYKEDAVDALSDYDGDKRYKVVSKKTLKSLGIENPNERFKSYEVGGGVGDLFQNYDEQPEELAEITNFYAQKFDEDDYDYEDSKNFLKAVEAIGYTFDYGLDNEPYGLRPIGTELDEYSDGGAIANQQLIADAHLRPAEIFGREGIPAYNKGGALKTERRYVNHSQDYETRYARKHPSRHGYGNIKYDGGGDVTQFGKFISSQIEHLISLKTIASKKEPIQNLLKNMDDYRGTEIEKRITTDNLKYALQQKTVSKMNEVLRISLNALKD
jgi:hypothetical protein